MSFLRRLAQRSVVGLAGPHSGGAGSAPGERAAAPISPTGVQPAGAELPGPPAPASAPGAAVAPDHPAPRPAGPYGTALSTGPDPAGLVETVAQAPSDRSLAKPASGPGQTGRPRPGEPPADEDAAWPPLLAPRQPILSDREATTTPRLPSPDEVRVTPTEPGPSRGGDASAGVAVVSSDRNPMTAPDGVERVNVPARPTFSSQERAPRQPASLRPAATPVERQSGLAPSDAEPGEPVAPPARLRAGSSMGLWLQAPDDALAQGPRRSSATLQPRLSPAPSELEPRRDSRLDRTAGAPIGPAQAFRSPPAATAAGPAPVRPASRGGVVLRTVEVRIGSLEVHVQAPSGAHGAGPAAGGSAPSAPQSAAGQPAAGGLEAYRARRTFQPEGDR